MPALASYCGALTLQVGVAISAILFFAISVLILVANVFDFRYSSGWHLNLMFMLIFAAAFIILGAFLFAAAFNEVRRWAVIAAVGIVILLAFWVILCCLSFFGTSDHLEAVCIDTRCPESLWIANLGYRRRNNDTKELVLRLDLVETTSTDSLHEGILPLRKLGVLNLWPEPTTGRISVEPKSNVHKLPQEPSGARRRRAGSDSSSSSANPVVSSDKDPKTLEAQNGRVGSTDATRDRTNDAHNAQNHEDYEMGNVNKMNHPDPFMARQNLQEPLSTPASSTTPVEKDKEEKSNGIARAFPFSGAVILFFANLVFLLYTAVLAWSYASELDWADYYVEDEVYFEQQS